MVFLPLPSSPHLSTELLENGVAIISYNRPEVANAVNASVSKTLREAIRWACEDSRVKVIVNTGKGNFFCSGMDLSEAAASSVDQDPNMQSLHDTNRCFIDCPKVMIAAVNGPAAGWGTSTLGFFDLVYSVPDAFFFTPFVQLGLCAEACCSFTLLHTMGRQKASRLILLGDRLSAQDLEAAGLITQILPKGTFHKDVMKIADRLCKLPYQALVANKSLLVRQFSPQLHEANNAECKMFGYLLQQDEYCQQKQSFLQQREAKKAKISGKL